MKPRLLDLFAGAGGAGMGYHLAGFDVVGVDIEPQPNYPFEFWQLDALDVLDWLLTGRWQCYSLGDFDVIHASPPCQHYARVTRWRGSAADHPDLLDATVARLRAAGVPFVVENVTEAIPRPTLVLCGSMFGLQVRRHRAFIVEPPVFSLLHPCSHHRLLPFMHKAERAYADAMGCTWMSKTEAREAIPPAYTQHIGEQLLSVRGEAA